MSATLKQLSELKQLCTEKNKIIQNIQNEIGFALLNQKDASVSQKDMNDYLSSLEKTKENDLLCKKVKDKYTEIEKIQQEITNVKVQSDDFNGQLDDVYLLLGSQLYSNYRECYSEFFKQYYDEISDLDKRLESLESQTQILKSQIENQGFLGKLVNQVKLTSSTSSVNSILKKKDSVMQKAGKSVVSAEKMDFIRCQENIEYSILEVLDKLNLINNEISRIVETQKNLTEKERVLKNEFSNICEGINLKSKLSHIEKANFEEQEKRKNLALDVGKKYSCNYISEKGERLDGFEDVVQNFPSFTELVESIESIYKAEIQLEIYQIESDIESCLSRIYNMQQSIISNEKKIENLKTANMEFADKINSAGELKDSLLIKKAEFQKKLQ